MIRTLSLALSFGSLLACSAPPAATTETAAPPTPIAPPAVPAPTSAPAAALPIAGYHRATIKVDATTNYMVGLTVAADEATAEMVTQFDPALPWTGVTAFKVVRRGNDVDFVFAGHTRDAKDFAIPNVKVGDVAFTISLEGTRKTTWKAYAPAGADAAGFVTAVPDVEGP